MPKCEITIWHNCEDGKQLRALDFRRTHEGEVSFDTAAEMFAHFDKVLAEIGPAYRIENRILEL